MWGKETRIKKKLLCKDSERGIPFVQKVRELDDFMRLCVSECYACGALPILGTSVLDM